MKAWHIVLFAILWLGAATFYFAFRVQKEKELNRMLKLELVIAQSESEQSRRERDSLIIAIAHIDERLQIRDSLVAQSKKQNEEQIKALDRASTADLQRILNSFANR